MLIRHQCRCGANIRLPAVAAGKRARCRSCGAVFTVPAGEGDRAGQPVPPGSAARSQEGRDDKAAYSWLEEFSRAENEAVGETPPPMTLETDEVDNDEFEATPLPARADDKQTGSDTGRDWVIGPEQPFWQDLAESFVFFLTPGNLVTFLVVALLNALTVPLAFAWILGLIGRILITGYLCAFCLSTIRETAGGEDELPNMWIGSLLDDLLMPLVQFVGTWLFVLLPALAVAVIAWSNDLEVPWALVGGLAMAGLALWPVVILGVAIGHGFRGLWPHVVIRTALAAPVAYLAVCAALVLTAGILLLPSTALFQSTVARVLPGSGVRVLLLHSVLTAYVMIASMRIIGLFYRHYKRRFPWAAE